MSQPVVLTHPLVDHHLLTLRDRQTQPAAFRAALHRLSSMLVVEATADLQTRSRRVTTPMAEAEGRRIAQTVGLAPILRAGLGMVDPALDLLPGAQVWHLGFYRDERTLEPVAYYSKLPAGAAVDVALVLDPMLATGGSAAAAIAAVRQWGASRIKLLSILAAPEGVARLQAEAADVPIYTCAVDSHLDDRGYIVPGLGDAGDRVFNAETGSE